MPTTKKTAPKKKAGRKVKRTLLSLKKLVIVESPSKASTIKKYLGRDYDVRASVGHLIDLPRSRMGVSLDTFEPDYIVMRDKYKVLKELREAAKSASEIILASDPDREGEAIAWHIQQDFEKNVLPKLKGRELPIKRVKFTEITEASVKANIQKPEPIDAKLVDAQQGRRVIDRIFGYQLSPLLWKKVKSNLSAGRVQSVALRILCDREDEIDAFVPKEYWIITSDVKKDKALLKLELAKIDGKKADIGDEAEASRVVSALKQGQFKVRELKVRPVARNPYPPFITSTLQQAANTVLGYASMKTMQIAQQLYEGVELEKSRTGLITYMRTDSTRISPVAIEQVRDYIQTRLGAEYLPEKPNSYSNKKSSQDAHEAIRPSSVEYTPESVQPYLTPEQFKLYSLIWKRFVASQMKPASSDQASLEVENGDCVLSASSSRVVFDGFLKIYDYSRPSKEKELPATLKAGDVLELIAVGSEQKFTDPPSRYSEASLVKAMEELGIGRPSTYAPTIFTITKRFYVKKEAKSLVPTTLGRAVNRLLVEHFPEMIDTGFTSGMEEKLDEVEEGRKEWKIVVKDFYRAFEPVLKHAYENMDSIKGSFDEKTDIVCEKCGKPMVKKLGKYGLFLACTGWPECRNAQPLPLGKCPKCGEGRIVEKKSGKGKAKGRAFYGCSKYPACDFISYQKPAEEAGNPVNCPVCGSVLFVEREKGQTRLKCLKEGCGYEHTKE